MNFKVYTVYDSKVEAYMSPFVMRSKGEAVRAFSDTVNEENSQFNKHPEDFTLFEIGEWNEKSGVLEMYAAKASLGLASEFKRSPLSDGPTLLKK